MNMSNNINMDTSGDFSFGEKIKAIRERKELSQERVAREIGFTRQTISNYEKGKKKANFETVVKFAKYYKVTTDYLLGVLEGKAAEQSSQEICDKTGLSLGAAKLLQKNKADISYMKALSFLIEEKAMLKAITDYMWSGFLDRLYEEPGFCDLPKNKARIKDADKTLFAGIMQDLGKFRTDAVAEYGNNKALVEKNLRDAAPEYADIPQCQEIWNKYHGTASESGLSSKKEDTHVSDGDRQQYNDFKDGEERAYAAIRKYLTDRMEPPKE